MTAPDASAVAALLREFGQRSALRGGNPFRAKAYARAADSLLALSLPLDQIVAQVRLREIPGIGDAIADIITAVVSKKALANVTPSFADALTAAVGLACVTRNRTHQPERMMFCRMLVSRWLSASSAAASLSVCSRLCLK